MRVLITSVVLLAIGLPTAWLAAQKPTQTNQESKKASFAPAYSVTTGEQNSGYRVVTTQQRTAVSPPAPPAPPKPATWVDGSHVAREAYFGLQPGVTVAGSPGLSYFGLRHNSQDPNIKEVRDLLIAFRKAKDEESREELRQQLVNLTTDSFETMMKTRREQLATAQEQLDKIKERLDKREELASDIINRRVADLLDEEDPLDWDFGPDPTGNGRSIYMYSGKGTAAAPLRFSAPAAVGFPVPTEHAFGVALDESAEEVAESLEEEIKRLQEELEAIRAEKADEAEADAPVSSTSSAR